MSEEDFTLRAHEACIRGDLKSIQEICKQYAEKYNKLDLNKTFLDKSMHKCTLMHKAARHNKSEIMDYLFKEGASVSSVDQIGATPLYYACLGNALDAVTFLTSHGAQVNIRDKREISPLQVALSEGYYELADLLILCKADVHFKIGNKGSTILHVAAKDGNKTGIDWLLNNDASFLRIDRNGNTPLAYCLGNPEIFLYVCERTKNIGNKELAKLLKCQTDMGETVLHLLAYNE